MTQRHLRLLAHNIRSLWNVGSFFRTADAFGVEKIYLTGYTGTPPRKEISKTAIGAEEWVSWEKRIDPMQVVRELKDEGFSIVSLELASDATDLTDYRPPEKVCLVLGHELTGVESDLLRASDAIVQIPMRGKKESLNVAVAAGIALYQLSWDERN